MTTPPSFTLETPSLTLQTGPDGTLAVIDNVTGQRILHSPSLELFAPVLEGERGEYSFSRAEQAGPGRAELHFQRDGLDSFSVRIEAHAGEDAFDFSCAFRTRGAT